MSNDRKQKEDDIQREINLQQKFSVTGVIGRQSGGAMKGASPVSRLSQVTVEIIQFIDHHLSDPSGALKSVLNRTVKANEVTIDHNLHEPILALREIIRPILENNSILYEFVRQVDVQWGQIFNERPHFQEPGQEPHPDDEYTHESVRKTLMDLMGLIDATINGKG